MNDALFELPDRDAWTVALGELRGRESVVVVPPLEDPYFGGYTNAFVRPERAWSAGLREARRLKGEGKFVRVIARGATLRSTWPAWLASSRDIALSEWDAYLPRRRLPLTDELVGALDRWLTRTFEGVLPDDVSPQDAFWGSAVHRIFIPALWSYPAVLGIGHHHRQDDVYCAAPDWIGALALKDLIEAAGGVYRAPRCRTEFRLRMAVKGAASVVGASAFRLVEYVRERPGRQTLRALRERSRTSDVSTWVGVLAGQPLGARHTAECAAAASRSGERVGILLQGSLRPAPGSSASNPFPALESPALEGVSSTVDQCSSAESIAELARTLWRGALASSRVVARLVQAGDDCQLGPMRLSLAPSIGDLARLATLDVLRAHEANAATRALLKRRPNMKRVVWGHASLVSMAVPDVILRRAGAMTYDLVHGAVFEPVLVHHDRTSSSSKVLWTQAEATAYAPYAPHQRLFGGYVPRPPASGEARERWDGKRPLRVLSLTAYLVHPEATKRLPLEGYQFAFFQALNEAIGAYGGPIELRWRPHPWDNREHVMLHARTNPRIRSVSLEPNALAEDLRWADVVVSSVSTALVEALSHPVHVLLHDVPLTDAFVVNLFDPVRRFSNGGELTNALARSLSDLRVGKDDPEDRLREALFGGPRPKALETLLWPSHARETAHGAHGFSECRTTVGDPS